MIAPELGSERFDTAVEIAVDLERRCGTHSPVAGS
jgi:hypothetical protein